MKSKKSAPKPTRNSISGPIRNTVYRRNHLKSFIYKTIIAVVFLLIMVLLKAINTDGINNVLADFKGVMNYKVDIVEDSKKIYGKLQTSVDKALGTIQVFSDNENKYPLPVKGEVFRDFNQTINIDGKKMKNLGLDIKTEEEEVASLTSGLIKSIEKKDNKGYYVTVEEGNIQFVYGYLAQVYAEEGSMIKAGDLLGKIGDNKDNNKYLRFEIYVDQEAANPKKYINY